MKCTVIVDNLAPVIGKRNFLAEHGLSLLIEHQGQKILFDTGESETCTYNLSLLGIHPNQIDLLVFSHGHHDHTGGLLPFLRVGNKKFPVVAHPDIFSSHYGRTGFAGIPYTRDQLTSLGVEWQLTDKPREIAPKLWFSAGIPRTNDFETVDKKLFVCCSDGSHGPDPLADDAALFYESDKGLVVIGGCAHSGLVNIVEYGLQLTGAKRLAGWIGGTHLGPADDRQRQKTIEALKNWDLDFLVTGHCTGFDMMADLRQALGERFTASTVGAEFEF